MKEKLPPPFPEEEYRWLATCDSCSWSIDRPLPYSAILAVCRGHSITSGHTPDIIEKDEGKETYTS